MNTDRRWLVWLFAFPAIVPLRADLEVKVTVQIRAPIQILDAQEHPSGVAMSAPGTVYTLVKIAGPDVVLKDAAGKEYQIGASATDYAPPTSTAPAPTSAPVASSTYSASPSPAPTPSPVDTSAASMSPDDAQQMKALNEALGFSLLSNDHFWDNNLTDVAKRTGWPQESQTSTQASYRSYSLKGTPIFGAPAYSMALYGKDGKPNYISIVFSNAGDFVEGKDSHGIFSQQEGEKIQKDLAESVKRDASTITDKLTAILGPAQTTLFGNSSSNREQVHRWDWKDVSFLVSTHGDQYATLKIIPSTAADHFGSVEVTERDELRDILAKRVVKRDNGDVVISEIPMVDQGPKGYCLPATWERYLRYVDVPADLYVLAMLGGTGFGGGTDPTMMRAGVDDYVSAYHRRIEVLDGPFDMAHVSRYIDKGLPLMWTCYVTRLGEQEVNKHTKARATVTDWDDYKTKIDADDKDREKAEPWAKGQDNGHMRMIIGYNPTTQEIAISDSWGEKMAERWMTLQQAKDISGGDLEYIQW